MVRRYASRAAVDQGPTSLFLFTSSSPLRRLVTWFVNTQLFEWTIILTIIANCVVMALDDKLPYGDKTVLSMKMEDLEPIFMIIFTIEMCTKILALGFILHKGSYMRNLWNIMDFVVVTSGFLPMMLPAGSEDSINLNTLRTFRVLRPLKLVSGVPSLQVVMSSIGKAIGPLVNIALLLLFAVIIFAIIGLEFYAGALNKTCYQLDDLGEIVIDGTNGSPCFPGPPEDAPTGAYTCEKDTAICLEKWEGPNDGITSFDNIGLAMLTVFQCVSMEGWTPILYSTNDAIGSAFNWVFFIPLIVVGSFFMLNLVLGVLSGEFAKEKDRVESRAGFLRLKEKQRLDMEMDGYMNWICRAEDLILKEERTTESDKKRIREARKKRLEEGKKKRKTEEEELAGASSEFSASIRRARIKIRRMCKQQWWFWLVIVLVFLNTCTVAVEHYNQPQWLTEFLFYAEFLFLGAFVFEMLIRLYALGPAAYFSSAFNRFDCAVITGSLLEVMWVNFKPRAGSFGLSGLRALRLLRVFKVTKYWSPLRNLVIALMNALSSIMSLLFLLFLFIFIFALLGMQLFGGSFNFDDGTPTSNFNTAINALLTVFQVLTEEDWNNVMYTAIISQGGRKNGGLVYSLYFVMLTLCGNYCLLNVFLAIACDSLDQAAELTANEEAEKERAAAEAEAAQQAEHAALDKAAGGANGDAALRNEDDDNRGDAEGGGGGAFGEEEDELRPILPYSSLFIFSSTNPVRVGIHWLVTKPLFDVFIMFVILLSSAALAAEDPVQENAPWNKVLSKFDYGFTAIFFIECLLKILDLGLMFHPGSFFRDVWNIMDGTVVFCALISLYFQGTPTGQKLKSVKLLRVLRPLKMVNRVPALKAVFDCVVTSLKNVFNILIVYMLFLLIFAMVGVQLFNGKFLYCTDAAKRTYEECQGEYFVSGEWGEVIPEVAEREWLIKAFNYDNCGAAMITLFAVQTSEGWVDVLQNSMSSTYEDEGPIPWFRTEMAIFYIVYFVVFPFFFVNIFVALVIVTFNDLGEAELTDDIDKNQKSCINYVIQAKPMQVYVPEEQSGCLFHIWRLVTSPPFENFIMLLIVMNTILLMLKYQGAPLQYTDLLSDFNLVFTILFTVECVMKLACFGTKAYFKDSWNTFDFITVVGSIIDATQIVNVGFLRLFRAARLIKLLRRSVSIRILLFTFVQSIKALPYVMMLMVMLFFIYAIVGMQLFGNIALDSSTAIERHNNFRNVAQAFMLLFRCSTGEAWPDIMMACIAGRTCDPRSKEINQTTGQVIDPDKKCGSNMTYFYFISFIFLCSFIMLNIVVAVIMDSFDYLTRDSSILGSHHLSEFITVWCEFDPQGEGKIHYTDMFALLKQIDPPLGFGSKCPDILAYKRLVRMNMPIDDEGKVHFTTTLFALVRVNLQIFVRSMDEMDQADQELRTTIGRTWPFVKRDGKIDLLVPRPAETGPNKLTVGKIYGGMLILENWKQTKFTALPPPSSFKKALPNGDAFGGGPTKLIDGKEAEAERRASLKQKQSNELVQNYLNTLEEPLPLEDDIDKSHFSNQHTPHPQQHQQQHHQQHQQQHQQQQRHPPKTFPEPIEPIYQNVPKLGDGGDEAIANQEWYEPQPHMLERNRGVSVDRHREYQTPQYYQDTYYREEENRRITVKHIHTDASRATSSLEHRRRLPERPDGAKLERQWSHPNLRPRPGGRRQLPKTPEQPPGTIIVIENVLPDKPKGKFSNQIPPGPPRRCESSAHVNHVHHALPQHLQKQPSNHHINANFSFSDDYEDDEIMRPRRSGSLPRRRTLPRARSASATTRHRLPAPPTKTPTAAVVGSGVGKGRRLPPTPHKPSSFPLHHTPIQTRKRELPTKPFEQLNRDMLGSCRTPTMLNDVFNNSAALLGRISSRSMNFPRVDGSPSRSGPSSYDDDPMDMESFLPLPSMPPGLRTTLYRHRRTLLE